MKITICDGCKKQGVTTDLSGNHKAWRVRLDGARVLDLCPDKCAPVFEKFAQERSELLNRTRDDTRRALDDLLTRFWEDLKRGS